MPKITNENGETKEISQEEYDKIFTVKWEKGWKPKEGDYTWGYDANYNVECNGVYQDFFGTLRNHFPTEHIAKMHAVKAKATSELCFKKDEKEIGISLVDVSFRLVSQSLDKDWLDKEHLGITYRECFEWFSQQS